MSRLLRIVGFLLMGAGALVFLTWFIEPLRKVWPWLLQLPMPLRVGLVVAGAGFLLLVATLIAERVQDREEDRQLRDD